MLPGTRAYQFSRLPQAMVLVYQPLLTHSIWQDFACRARTRDGLIKLLRAGVKRGDWVGWRLITIEAEAMGDQ